MTLFSKNEIETLLKMANKYDEEGRTEEALALDSTIQKLLVNAAKEDEDEKEKGSRQMSGKAKAKFRTIKKAAESLVSADLDYRGPSKSSCRKVEMLCEEILEALKDCDFE